MERIHKFFNQFDIFASLPTLRAKKQSKSTNLFSGIISFILTIIFVYVFVINSIGLITYSTINSVQTQSRISGTKVKANSIYFAARVGYLLVQQSLKYLQIGYYLISKDGTNTSHALQPCKQQQWKIIGNNYKQQIELFDIQQYFCPKSQQNLSLQKVYAAPQSQYIIIYVRPCIGQPYCQNQTIQQQFMQNITNIDGAIFFQVYFLDQAINPTQKQPISYFINSQCQFGFTNKRCVLPIVQFSTYRVQTDMSILPFQNIQIKQGNFVDLYSQTSCQIKSYTDNYVFLYLTMNRKYINIKRKVGKLDQMLSYAGGLFSILVGFLAFFMNSFNQYRYQLMVAQGLFPQDQNGKKIRQKDFTFLKYIKYIMYDWISTIFCFNLQWKDCKLIDQTRNQANSHMDATRLFKKLQIFQNILQRILGKYQKDCIQLIKPQSLGQVRKNRLIIDYYDTITQGKQVLTIQQYKLRIKIYKLGLSILQKTKKQNKIVNADIQQQQEEYYQQIIDLQKIKDSQEMLEIGLKKFKQIQKDANKITLRQQLKQIECDLSYQFFKLNLQFRNKIIEKIPIIILIRLLNNKKIRQNDQIQQSKMKQGNIQTKQMHQHSQSNILIKQTPSILQFNQNRLQNKIIQKNKRKYLYYLLLKVKDD